MEKVSSDQVHAQPLPLVKRAWRDRLAQYPAGSSIRLMGPRGVGKRTLVSRLPHLRIQISSQRLKDATLACESRVDAPDKTVHLHPLLVTEIGIQSAEQFEQFLSRGGFPEMPPNQVAGYAVATLPAHLRATLSDTESTLGTPMARDDWFLALHQEVGHPLSIRALAQRLSASDYRLKQWLSALEHHFGLFTLAPLKSTIHGQSFRALKKNTKIYPYTWHLAPRRHLRMEALVANHLLAWVQMQTDWEERSCKLHYFRDCDQREVDFVVIQDNVPVLLVQCDAHSHQHNSHLAYLHRKFPSAVAWHLSLDGPMTPICRRGIYTAHPLPFLRSLDSHSQHALMEADRM